MDNRLHSVASLLGRVLLAAIFLVSGLHKIADFPGTQRYMAAMGMPLTGLFLVGAILLELTGSASLLLGYWTRVGAALLIVFMIPTTLIFHTDFSEQIQLIMFMKNAAIVGGLLCVLAFGPGRLSLDGRTFT